MQFWLTLLIVGPLYEFLEASDLNDKTVKRFELNSPPVPVRAPVKRKKQRWTDEELKAMAAADAAGPSSILVAEALAEEISITVHCDGPLHRFFDCLSRFLQLVDKKQADDSESLYRIESFLEGLLEFLANLMEELQLNFDFASVQSFLAVKFELLMAGMDVEAHGYSIVSREEMILMLEEVIRLAPSLLTSASECSSLSIQLRAMIAEDSSLMPFVHQFALEAEYFRFVVDSESSSNLSGLISAIHGRLFAVNRKSFDSVPKMPWPFSSLVKQPASKDQKRFLKFLDVLETVIIRGLKAPKVAISFFRTFDAIGKQFNKLLPGQREEESFILQVEEHPESLPFINPEDLVLLSAPLEEALFEEITPGIRKTLIGRIQVNKDEFPDSEDSEEEDSMEKRRRQPRRRVQFRQAYGKPENAELLNPTLPTINNPANLNQQELLRQLMQATTNNPVPTQLPNQMSALLGRMGENQLPDLSGPSLISYVKKSSLPRLLNSLIKAKFGVDVLKSLGQVLRVLNEFLGIVEVALKIILKLIQFVRYYCLQVAQFVTELAKEEVSLQDDHSIPLIRQVPVNKAAEILSTGLAALTTSADPFHAGLQGAVKKAREQGESLRRLPGPLLLTILHTSFMQISSSKGIIVAALSKKHASFGEMNTAAIQAFTRIYESIKVADPSTAEHLCQCPASILAEILVAFLIPAQNTAIAINKQFSELFKFLSPLLAVTGSEAQLSMLAFLLSEGEDAVRLLQIAPESKSYLYKLSQKMTWSNQGRLSSSSKVETGITGLLADPSARQSLLQLYNQLSQEAASLPPSYAYGQGILAMTEHRMRLLRDEKGRRDVDVEKEIGGGQLEELVEQAKGELELMHKIKQEWKPWLNE